VCLQRAPCLSTSSVTRTCPTLARAGRAQLTQRLGKRVHIVVPDEGEYNRSYRMCARVQGTLTV